MKIKFFGEGPDDVGKHEVKNTPCTIQAILKNIIEKPLERAVNFEWMSNHIPRIHAGGFTKKVEIAMKKAVDRGYDAAIFIVDYGGKGGEKRIKAMKKGREIGHKRGYYIPMILAVSRMELEAWLLADENVRTNYFPRSVSQSFGKIEEEKNPKALFSSLYGENVIKEQFSEGELKLKIASESDVTTITKNCPKSFKPFVDEVREKLIPRFKERKEN